MNERQTKIVNSMAITLKKALFQEVFPEQLHPDIETLGGGWDIPSQIDLSADKKQQELTW